MTALNEGYARRTLVTLSLINLLNFFDRQIPAVVAELIRKEFSLNDTDLGLLATSFTLIYAIFGLPLGRLADTWQRPKVIAVGLAVWSVFTAVSGVAWNYASLFTARLGVGIGEASFGPSANAMIAEAFPGAKRARALAWFMVGLPVGIFLANVLVGWIAQTTGSWRLPFLLAGIPGVLIAIVAWRLPAPKRGDMPAATLQRPGRPGSAFLRLFRIPTLWCLIAAGALHNFCSYAMNVFLPPFLARVHGFSTASAGSATAVSLGAVGLIGLFAGGAVADRFHRPGGGGRLGVAAVATALATPLIFLALMQPVGDSRWMLPLLACGWMLTFVFFVTAYAAIQDVVPDDLRATAMAVYFFANYLIGGSLGTLVVGGLSDRFARAAMHAAGATAMADSFRAAGLAQAMFTIPTLMVAVVVALTVGARTLPSDTQLAPSR